MFLDDLTDILTEWMASFRNLIICWDFNIHIDDPNDTEAQIFNDTMEALALQQHIGFPTYHAGNTLDLIFTETMSQLNTKTSKGRYILDHRAIMTELDIRIQHTFSKMVTFRNLKLINVEEFKSALNFGSIENKKDLELVNEKYENELTRVLNQLTAEKMKLFIKKEKRPWFDEGIANMKRVLRRCENIWVRNGTEDCWRVYQQARRLYQGKIVEKKREIISKKIKECGSDSRKLFQLVNHLTGYKLDSPLLTRNNNKELADKFADFS